MTGLDRVDRPGPDGEPGELIAAADLPAARRAVAELALRTPVVPCAELSELAGGPVLLKAECLQVTGSFKIRGALNRVASLGDAASAGLVTASAGNHARAVAHAARAKGLGCEVFMPHDAPVSKVLAVESLGATVRFAGATVDEALDEALAAAREAGAAFVHPFDDPDVIAGQATLGLELVEQVPGLARVIVPVGGGGLAGGIGIALRREGSPAELVGVQAELCAPFAGALADPGAETAELQALSETTIADGVAVKRPGRLTLPLLRALLDGMTTVTEDEI